MIITGKVSIAKAAWNVRRQIGLVLLSSMAAVFIFERLENKDVSIQITPLTALGVALGVFMSLRNNVVYNRYWEARSLWGKLINTSRTLPRQLTTYLTGGTAEEREAVFRDLCLRQIAFVKAMRAHLRDENPREDAAAYLPPEEIVELRDIKNIPTAILHRMGERLHDTWRRGLISEYHLAMVDGTMTELTDILGGCEKIKNTPIPPAYTYLGHKLMLAYCCMLPFALVADLHFFTPLVTVTIAFAFLILDQTSDLIEIPFATEENDLPLNAMTRTIEVDLLQRLGEKNVPPPVEAVDGVLL
jgi:ion channel-forming bestrophin family protein